MPSVTSQLRTALASTAPDANYRRTIERELFPVGGRGRAGYVLELLAEEEEETEATKYAFRQWTVDRAGRIIENDSPEPNRSGLSKWRAMLLWSRVRTITERKVRVNLGMSDWGSSDEIRETQLETLLALIDAGAESIPGEDDIRVAWQARAEEERLRERVEVARAAQRRRESELDGRHGLPNWARRLEREGATVAEERAEASVEENREQAERLATETRETLAAIMRLAGCVPSPLSGEIVRTGEGGQVGVPIPPTAPTATGWANTWGGEEGRAIADWHNVRVSSGDMARYIYASPSRARSSYRLPGEMPQWIVETANPLTETTEERASTSSAEETGGGEVASSDTT